MGADDGDHCQKPHPAANHPQAAPCDDGEGPGLRGRFDLPRHWPRIVVNDARPQQQQVTEPAGYAVAGKIFLAAAGALAGVLLALVAMYLYSAARRRRLAAGGGGGGGGGRRRLDRSPGIAGEDDRSDGASAATPRGIDPAVLRALPVLVVPAAGERGGDCAVCLGELQPGEKARALPRCAHVFHAECIDAWFQGNATCPLCRADVEVVAPPPPPQPEVRVYVRVDGAADAKPASTMGRLPSGTDLDKTRRAFFASTRSVSF
ncbi:hypothetical protein PR202_ga31592 [Eleusine coracana subsp. coracana]|uniref:RING-type E3 ubiquitin transferase n=1 Tax=Eleusine coracana subsp. coracana TaxID=191504 RepID=A0AAV5DSQ2_ELECO|nr:hypothetical protein QOZ80_1AG0014460 [Eleusine coracana subsp. coracana]GJN13241.1 hypothetical protein PR202_ga31592 [Eleusine coracana subsp. coracana]